MTVKFRYSERVRIFWKTRDFSKIFWPSQNFWTILLLCTKYMSNLSMKWCTKCFFQTISAEILHDSKVQIFSESLKFLKINPNFSKNYCQIFLKNCAKGTVWKILTCITQLFNVNIRPEILAKVIPSTFILWAITVSLTFWSQFDIASEQDVVWDPEIWVNSIKNWFNFFKRTDKKTSRKEGIESSKRVFIYIFSSQ